MSVWPRLWLRAPAIKQLSFSAMRKLSICWHHGRHRSVSLAGWAAHTSHHSSVQCMLSVTQLGIPVEPPRWFFMPISASGHYHSHPFDYNAVSPSCFLSGRTFLAFPCGLERAWNDIMILWHKLLCALLYSAFNDHQGKNVKSRIL